MDGMRIAHDTGALTLGSAIVRKVRDCTAL